MWTGLPLRARQGLRRERRGQSEPRTRWPNSSFPIDMTFIVTSQYFPPSLGPFAFRVCESQKTQTAAEDGTASWKRLYPDRRGAGDTPMGSMPSCCLARLGDGALNRRGEFFSD
jgi:hypothetical protein